jgi:hypothetical protein
MSITIHPRIDLPFRLGNGGREWREEFPRFVCRVAAGCSWDTAPSKSYSYAAWSTLLAKGGQGGFW